jgi:hypothetical protein
MHDISCVALSRKSRRPAHISSLFIIDVIACSFLHGGWWCGGLSRGNMQELHQQINSCQVLILRSCATFSVSVMSSLLAESELVKKIACKIARYVLLSTIKNDFTLTHVPFHAFRSTRALRGTRHFDNGILWMPGTEITYSSTCRLFRLTLMDANMCVLVVAPPTQPHSSISTLLQSAAILVFLWIVTTI